MLQMFEEQVGSPGVKVQMELVGVRGSQAGGGSRAPCRP